MEEMRKSAGKSYAIAFLWLVAAFVLGKIIDISSVNSAFYGLKIGFAIGLGFVTRWVDGQTVRQPSRPGST